MIAAVATRFGRQERKVRLPSITPGWSPSSYVPSVAVGGNPVSHASERQAWHWKRESGPAHSSSARYSAWPFAFRPGLWVPPVSQRHRWRNRGPGRARWPPPVGWRYPVGRTVLCSASQRRSRGSLRTDCARLPDGVHSGPRPMLGPADRRPAERPESNHLDPWPLATAVRRRHKGCSVARSC